MNKKTDINRQLSLREYDRLYYHRVRKMQNKKEKCRKRNIEYVENKEIKVKLEFGKHIIEY